MSTTAWCVQEIWQQRTSAHRLTWRQCHCLIISLQDRNNPWITDSTLLLTNTTFTLH